MLRHSRTKPSCATSRPQRALGGTRPTCSALGEYQVKQCWGLKRNLTRCQRTGDWRLFCDEHKRQPLVWLFTLVFTVIAGSASIYSCALRPALPTASGGITPTNTVLRIRPDDNNISIPSFSDTTATHMLLPLILWCDAGTTCDLDAIVMQKFDKSTGEYIGPASSLTDQSGSPISFPLRITDAMKASVILRFPLVSTNEPHLKARVRFVGYKPKDTTVVEVEIERQAKGYRGMIMSHDRLYNFGSMSGTQTVEFLKPYRETPDIMIKEK